MLKEDVGSLPVMKKGKVVGIITERDITRIFAEKGETGPLETNVESVMSTPTIAIESETPILDALEIMVGNRIRRLPVTKNDKLAGIVTERDIVVWFLKEIYKPFIPEDLRKFVDKIDRLQKL
jgi:CBS domain-containing protein